jgi:glycosyltransferase involved in cell wall biosynthesis
MDKKTPKPKIISWRPSLIKALSICVGLLAMLVVYEFNLLPFNIKFVKDTSILKNTMLLTMVKNERHTLPRLLASVRPHLEDPSWVFVCDTGSTDGTVEWLKSQEKRLLWTQVPWVNYAVTRTHCMRLVSQLMSNRTHLFSQHFVLFLDADHTLTNLQAYESDKHHLIPPKADLNMIHIANEDWDNYLPYLLSHKAANLCYYESDTHEYLHCPEQLELSRHHYIGFQLNHHADGGNRANKLTNDYNILSAGFANKTTPPYLRRRYAFYMGRTLEDMGQYVDAIKWYQLRAQWGGWIEEAFFAQYRIAMCMYLQNGNYTFEQQLEANQKAIRMLPYRAEPYYQIARLYRNRNDMPKCVYWAAQGTQHILQRKPDSLFIDNPLYSWQLHDELALCLYYSNAKDMAKYQWAHILGTVPNLPLIDQMRLRGNLR